MSLTHNQFKLMWAAYLAGGSTTTGTNTGDQLIFKTIAVSGQSDVVADTTADTLTLVAGTNITITTNATTDSITINASGGGATNLTTTVAASTVTINSDTGTDAIIPAATGAAAGVLTASDKTKLDGIATGATALSITATSVTLPYAARSTVTVTDATVTATSKILIGWGNSLDTDTNDCEMDDVTFKTKAASGSFALTIASARNIIGGVFKLNYQVAA